MLLEIIIQIKNHAVARRTKENFLRSIKVISFLSHAPCYILYRNYVLPLKNLVVNIIKERIRTEGSMIGCKCYCQDNYKQSCAESCARSSLTRSLQEILLMILVCFWVHGDRITVIKPNYVTIQTLILYVSQSIA